MRATRTETFIIDDVAAGGDGVGHLNGKVCFVPLAAPGDLVEVKIVKENKQFKRCEIVEVLKPGSSRKTPRCSFFGICGGCAWQHIDEGAQLKAKKAILSRVVGFSDVDVVASPLFYGYRHLARIHGDAQTQTIGFMRREQNTIVDIDHCDVLKDKLSLSIKHIKQFLLSNLDGRFEVRAALGKDGVGISIEGIDALPSRVYAQAEALVSLQFSCVCASMDKIATTLAGNELISTLGSDGLELVEPVTGFSQANSDVSILLCAKTAEWIKNAGYKTGIELFSGSGNLTVSLAPVIGKIDAVEIDEHACAAARINLLNRGQKNAKVHRGDAFEHYLRLRNKQDLIVLDPPRTGHIELSRAIASGRHKAVLYISCDPATLSRDLKELLNTGFKVSNVLGFDMFPQTPHMEVAVLVER